MSFGKFVGVHHRNRVEAYMRKYGKSKFFDFDYPDDKKEEARKYVSNCKKYAVWIYVEDDKLAFDVRPINGIGGCKGVVREDINGQLKDVVEGLEDAWNTSKKR